MIQTTMMKVGLSLLAIDLLVLDDLIPYRRTFAEKLTSFSE